MPRAALAPRSSTFSTLRLVVTARVCQLSVRPSGTSPFECGLRQALFVWFQLDALRSKNTLDERTCLRRASFIVFLQQGLLRRTDVKAVTHGRSGV